ncbi:hypothetical protein [Halobaculum lipolyticum]|uniref:Uncharacterized protein n=1 Tax=Halobaculum lipolyticum TaxID=3032001 RepID=A0ABD5W8D2_9EURY|nr:hypothetical protein [Halobaculum sp. DT31]
MSTESPPSLRESLRSREGAAVAVAFVLLALYAVLIQAQILVVVYYASVALLLWLLYRFVRAHERIASAQERRATAASGPASAHAPGGSGVAEAGDQGDGEHDREE